MLIKQLIEIYEILDGADASGEKVKKYMLSHGAEERNVKITKMEGEKGFTDFVKIKIPGVNGKTVGGKVPTIGVIGRLGGLGARPERIGFVSDGDGALVALSVASKLLDMKNRGDNLEGDVIVCTHVCPDAPTSPHKPVPFMGSPVNMQQMNEEEIDDEMEAILSVDTTKGNRIINHRGFAVSPTVKEGYILKVSEDLLDIMQITTGQLPKVFALSNQDVTPYGNGLFHINSILQPSTATEAPVVGVAITTETMVAGCATGATHCGDLEETARFVIEVAKAYGRGECDFYDKQEFEQIISKYGSMKHLQKLV
ncbi:DUF1177 domain-containing protein [Faecalimonas sp.]